MARPKATKKWPSHDALWEAVLDLCSKKFLERHEVEWNPEWETGLAASFDRERLLGQRGRPIVEELRSALTKAAEFLVSAGVGLREPDFPGDDDATATAAYEEDERRLIEAGPAAQSLRRWFSWHLGGDLWEPELWDTKPESIRSHLVRLFVHATANGGEGLPKGLGALFVRDDKLRTRVMPTHRELAVISILCGEFPAVSEDKWKTSGITTGDVLGLEAHALLQSRGHVLSSESQTVVGYDLLHAHHLRLEPAVQSPVARPRRKK